MEPNEYLKKHHLMTYIQDLTSLVIENRNSKTLPREHPVTIMEKYFHKVLTGVHIYQRDYAFTASTLYNRACFIRMIWQCYHKGLTTVDILLSCTEFHQLLELVCADFSKKFTDSIARLITCKSHDSDSISFCDFIYTFQVLFYYEDFITDCERLFNIKVSSDVPSGDTDQDDTAAGGVIKGVVVLPRLQESDSPPTSTENAPQDINCTDSTLTWTKISDSVQKLCTTSKDPERVRPSEITIRDVIDSCIEDHNGRMFDYFLKNFCNSDGVNSEIGILPVKEQFRETAPPALGSPFRFNHH